MPSKQISQEFVHDRVGLEFCQQESVVNGMTSGKCITRTAQNSAPATRLAGDLRERMWSMEIKVPCTSIDLKILTRQR